MEQRLQAYIRKILVTEGRIPPGNKDAEFWKVTLQGANPTGNQVAWIRTQIFSIGKEAIKAGIEPEKVMDKTLAVFDFIYL